VLAVWLESLRVPRDQRKPGDPSMKLESRLLAPDGSTLQEWTVDPDVCTCCQTTLTVLPGDRAFVAYRGHTREEIRDNHFALFNGSAWEAPQVLFNDRWLIPACPVNGPATDALGESLAVVWFTAAEGKPRVRAKISGDGGASFGGMLPIDLGQPMGRVDLAMLPDQSTVVTWMEISPDPKAAGIYARRIYADGGMSAAVRIADSTQARASGFARLAVRPDDQVLMAWTEEGAPGRVRTQLFAAPTGRVAGRSFSVPFSQSTTARPAPELCDPSAVTHGEQP
jgi:hypothetical protein